MRALPEEFSVFVDTAKSLGVKAYLVGGYVRSMITGDEVRDIDILVMDKEKALTFAEYLSKNYGFSGPYRYRSQRREFERIMLKKGKMEVEIIPPRGETLKEDLLHRDFTINTLVVPLSSVKEIGILDPLGTAKVDIKSRIIRTPRLPDKTFWDDPVRMIRAGRFAGELGFAIDGKVVEAIHRLSSLLKEVPPERIGEEMLKVFEAKDSSTSLLFLRDCGALSVIAPEISHALYKDQKTPYHVDDLFTHTLKVVSYTSGKDTSLKVAAFFHDIGKAYTEKYENGKWVYYGHEKVSAQLCEEVTKRWGFPKKIRDRAVFIVRNHMIIYRKEWSDAAVRRLIFKLGDHLWDVLDHYLADVKSTKGSKDYAQRLRFAEELRKRVRREIIRMRTPKIKSLLNGYEIQEILNIPPSPLVGDAKRFILNNMIVGRIRTKDDAIQLLLKEFVSRHLSKDGR